MFDDENEDDDLFLSDIGSLSQIYDEKPNYNKCFTTGNRYKKRTAKHSIPHWDQNRKDGFVGEKKFKSTSSNKSRTFVKDDYDRILRSSGSNDLSVKEDVGVGVAPIRDKCLVVPSLPSDRDVTCCSSPPIKSTHLDLYDDDDDAVVLPEQNEALKQLKRIDKFEEDFSQAKNVTVDRLYDEFELNCSNQNKSSFCDDEGAKSTINRSAKSLSDSLSDLIYPNGMENVPWRKNKMVGIGNHERTVDEKSKVESKFHESCNDDDNGRDEKSVAVEKQAFGKWLDKEYSSNNVHDKETKLDLLSEDRGGGGGTFSLEDIDEHNDNGDDGYGNAKRERTNELLDENYPNTNRIIDMSYLYTKHKPMKISIENNSKVEEKTYSLSRERSVVPYLDDNDEEQEKEQDDVVILEDDIDVRDSELLKSNMRRSAPDFNTVVSIADSSKFLDCVVGKATTTSRMHVPSSDAISVFDQRIPVLSLSRSVVESQPAVSLPLSTMHISVSTSSTSPKFAVPHVKQSVPPAPPVTSVSTATVCSSPSISSLSTLQSSFNREVIGPALNHRQGDRSLISGLSIFADSHLGASSYSDPVFVSRNPLPLPPSTNYMNPFQQSQSSLGMYPSFTGSALNQGPPAEFFHNHPTATVAPYLAYSNPLSQPQSQPREWMSMNPPAPISHSVIDVPTVPGESAIAAKPVYEDAVKEEIRQQNKELMAQREQYYEKYNLLGEELDKLKRQKKDLMEGKKSHQTEQFLRENNRLQNEIQNKIKAVRNVIDMLSKIIKDERDSKFKNMDEKLKKSSVDGPELKDKAQLKANSKERRRSKHKYSRSRSRSRHRSRSQSVSVSRSRSRSRGKRSSSSKRSRSQHRGRSNSRGRSSSSRPSHSPRRYRRKDRHRSTDKHHNERSPYNKRTKNDTSKKSDKLTTWSSEVLPPPPLKDKNFFSKTTVTVAMSETNNSGTDTSISHAVAKPASERAADQSGHQSLHVNSHYLKYYSEKFKPFSEVNANTVHVATAAAACEMNQATNRKQKKKLVNYVYYDPEIHWCSVCNVFPKTAKEYLTHLHSSEHKNELTKQNLIDYPWHKTQSEMKTTKPEDGPSQRVPIRGLPFFVSATAWFCKLCDEWMGDLHCASAHLKSDLHAEKYEQFIGENPSWEDCWLRDRHRAQEQFLIDQQRLLFTCAVPPSHPHSTVTAAVPVSSHREAKPVKARTMKKQLNSSSNSSDSEDDDDSSGSSSSNHNSPGVSDSSSVDSGAQTKWKKSKKIGKSSSKREKLKKHVIKKSKSTITALKPSSKDIKKAEVTGKNSKSWRTNNTIENSEYENTENDKFVDDEWMMNPVRNTRKGKELLELKSKIKKKEADEKTRRRNVQSCREGSAEETFTNTSPNDTLRKDRYKDAGSVTISALDNKNDKKSIDSKSSKSGGDECKRGSTSTAAVEESNVAIATSIGSKRIFKFPFIGKMPSKNLKKNDPEPKLKTGTKGMVAVPVIKSSAAHESVKSGNPKMLVTIQKNLQEYDKANENCEAELDSCNTAVVDMDINEDEDEPVSIVIDDNDNRRKDFEETLKILYPEERKNVNDVHVQQPAHLFPQTPQFTFQGHPYNLTQDYLISLIESTLIDKLKLKLPAREANPSSTIVELATSMQQALFTSEGSTIASMTNATVTTAVTEPLVTTMTTNVMECGSSSVLVPVKSVTSPVSHSQSVHSISPSSVSSSHHATRMVANVPTENDVRSNEEPADDVRGEQSRNSNSEMTEAGHKKKKNPISQKKRRHLRKIREKLEEQEKQLQQKIEETRKNLNETKTEIETLILPIDGIDSDLMLLGIEEGDSAALQF